jgi:hypothetical protein
MDTQTQTTDQPIRQPLTPEQVSPEQAKANAAAMQEGNPTLNPGDIVNRELTLEEKAKKVAVNVADITGHPVVVPTYFIVNDPDEGQKALHHVHDAEEISDVIRQARMDENGDRTWW